MMNIDSALQRLMRSESDKPVNVIVGVRVGAKSFQAALDAACFITTGSSDFGGEVYLYGRIRAKDLAKLGGIEEIEFITPDTEERLM